MGCAPGVTHEDKVKREIHADRWSKDLVGTKALPTSAGFSIGVAEYTATEFGEMQRHDDQEAVYCVSGAGEILIGGRNHAVRPGFAAYIPPRTKHATRRTGGEPVRFVYAHGAV